MTRSHIFVFVVTAFSVVACVLRHACSCLIHLCARLKEGIFLFWTVCLKTFHLGTVCVCLAWTSPLPRYGCCDDCLYCDLENSETGNWRSTGLENTVYTVSLVAEQRPSQFHDGMKKLQRWNLRMGQGKNLISIFLCCFVLFSDRAARGRKHSANIRRPKSMKNMFFAMCTSLVRSEFFEQDVSNNMLFGSIHCVIFDRN